MTERMSDEELKNKTDAADSWIKKFDVQRDEASRARKAEIKLEKENEKLKQEKKRRPVEKIEMTAYFD